jgi:phage virion morphogenesis protein
VAVGTNRVYAAIHQLGGQAGRGRKVTIPARPYLGVSAADRVRILAVLKWFLARRI